MELEQQVCSQELAKKLQELGVRQGSFFFWARTKGEENYHLSFRYNCQNHIHEIDEVSAWSVAELGEMLPRYILTKSYSAELTIVRSSVWRFYYAMNTPEAIILTAWTKDSEADARARMLIYLLENKFINNKI